MGEACSTHGRDEIYTTLVGKREGKRPFRGTRRRWEDNIRTDLRESGKGCVGFIWLRIGPREGLL